MNDLDLLREQILNKLVPFSSAPIQEDKLTNNSNSQEPPLEVEDIEQKKRKIMDYLNRSKEMDRYLKILLE